ncbi:MAG: hypothetical protein ABS76_33610 [Pelagibacterium sp. SCN 64-44]|nr:MAG: hypothetical protein ABS76_33610 [Pelagibacterium sp. SCN 64-44]
MSRIVTVSASSQIKAEDAGCVVISGSYGGQYNAYHAGKWGLRGVVLNDAGIGRNDAGIDGLPYLDTIGLPAATADAMSCHIADGEHMLAHGRISHVNAAAAALGCVVGESVSACAERMLAAPPKAGELPPIAGGRRYHLDGGNGRRKVVALDAAPLLLPEDADAIAVTGSHAALFRGKPDDIVNVPVFAIFFNDAGVGLDGAGIARLPTLDERGIIAGAVDCMSAPIGNARAIYADGILSHVNATARDHGAVPGMALKSFIQLLQAEGDAK